ncbi:MAG: 50S ribosomal protein L11 methyltransferase [Sphingobium sp.]|nr:50S ribosomal protein L11 methyltransferase [Sphingobium sp.]
MSKKNPAPSAWQLSLPCTRAQAEALETDEVGLLAELPSPPAILSSEPDESRPDDWRVDVIFDHKPDQAEIDLILGHFPKSAAKAMTLEPVPDVDWVTQSQAGLEPISAGPFHVRHDAAEKPMRGAINFLIPASRAFGTGQHETTRGCLMMLADLRRTGHRFGHIADIGTGTGLLAFAALKLWPRAHMLASDIDPVSVEVTAENAAMNGIPLGTERGEAILVAAPGVDHDLIEGLAPYDLLIANILAGPLIELAPSLSAQLAEGGSLILAGLLNTQADRVIAAYRAQGLRLAARVDHGDWPTLHLRKRRRFGWRRPVRANTRDNGRTDDFGSW